MRPGRTDLSAIMKALPLSALLTVVCRYRLRQVMRHCVQLLKTLLFFRLFSIIPKWAVVTFEILNRGNEFGLVIGRLKRQTISVRL